ncbi:MAG: hypothetical protein WEA99_05805 [Brumimicrobium sp.]
MKPNLKNNLSVLTFMLIFFQFSYSQVLKNVDLDLNPGGAIYDVAYDSYLDAYIVVGDFTEIQGLSINNIAFVDAETFDVLPTSRQPYINVDGPIRTVELHKKESEEVCNSVGVGPLSCFQSQGRYSLFIGGDFNTVDGQSRIKLARLGFTFFYSPDAGDSYGLMAWNAEIQNDDPSNNPYFSQVNDFSINGDTMVITGDFYIHQPSYDININRFNIIAFNAGYSNEEYIDLFTESFDNYSLVPYLNNLSSNEFTSIDFFDNKYLISTIEGTDNGLFTVDVNSNYITDFVDVATNHYNATDYTLSSYEGVNPLVYVTRKNTNSSTTYPVKYDINGNYMTLSANESWIGNTFITSYKDYVFTVTGISSQPSRLKTYKRTLTEALFESQLTFNHNGLGNSNSFYDWLPSASNKLWQPKKMIVEEDKLFFTGGYLTHVDGSSHKGLAVLCLEPSDVKPFTVADTTICAGNVREYTVPEAKYAEGYKWTYTGQGARVTEINGNQITPDTLNPGQPIYYDNINAYSITIEFGSNTTDGDLSVEPYSTCNSTNDYITSKGQSINLVTAPLPSLSMIADTMAFTCINSDSLNLEMVVSATNYSFEWKKGTDNTPLSTDSLFTVYKNSSTSPPNALVSSDITFYGYTTEPVNGCTSTDSIYVHFDTLGPIFTQNDLSRSPDIFDCSTNQMTFSGNVPGAEIQWGLTNSTTFANDTFTIYSPLDTTSFYAHATDTVNGCKTTTQYGFDENLTLLEGEVVNYGGYGGGTLDTVRCNQDSLMLPLILSSDPYLTQNDSISWIYDGNYIGDSLQLTTTDSVNAINNSKVYQYVTYSDSSKCIDTSNVIIYFDFEVPFVANYLNPPTLNCSVDSVMLVHPDPPNANKIKGWLDATNVNTLSDSLTVNDIGLYYYETANVLNGCKNVDTVEVFESNQLLLNSTLDTTICIGDAVAINANPINYTDPVDYDWSNGETSQTISVIGGVDDTLVVTATSLEGCVGVDTVVVSVNQEMNASFNTIAGCLDGSASIAVDTILGGAGSYSYSIDGQNFNGSGTFTNLDFGTYAVTVQDGIGCEKSFDVEINNSAQAPDINFLIPTYNEVGDTVIAVNISNFNGFDSLYWDLPGNTDVIGVSDSMLVFSIGDEDWYDIGIVAYQDTCSFRFEKSIYFGPYKPSFEQDEDTLGITNLTIYPNPTNGQFTVDLSFGIAQLYSIIITNSNGQVIPQMNVSGNADAVNESFTFPAGTPPGSFNVNIISEYDARNNQIILN